MKTILLLVLMAVSFPVLGAPKMMMDISGIAQRNVTLLFFFLIAYYCVVWYCQGRDPIKKTVMPQYRAPSDVSVGTAYMLINKNHWSSTATTATLLQMVVNGFLTMNFEPKTQTFKFCRTDKTPSNGEERMYPLTMGNNPLIIKSHTPNEDVYGLNNSFEFIAKKSTDNIYATNHNYVWPMAGLFYFLLPLCFSLDTFFTFFELFFSQSGNMIVVEGAILGLVVYALSKGTLIRRLLLAVPTAFLFAGVTFLFCQNLYTSCIVFGSVFVITVFGYLMGRPTIKGKRLQEHLEGFKMFLSTTQIVYQETKTNRDLLPYAIALGVSYPEQEQRLNYFIHQGIQLYEEKIRSEENTGGAASFFLGRSPLANALNILFRSSKKKHR